ncbi:tyrosyl-DNA phosphodiesterase 1-like isoform X2 [Halichondria panicea]|uniref:tyrosyl-DNA phosphodiesterase 1-like isoform X2 n=1 Tax=Halichondria panicea TaxID=6063 RepID=UPI00312B3168
MDKSMCKYGRECYRKNPEHFKQFSHPADEELEEPPKKKPRTHCTDEPVRITDSSTAFFYFTKVRNIAPRFNEPTMAIGIKDLLSESVGDLVMSAQFNYVFDLPWLIQQYPEAKRSTPMLIVYGDQRETTLQLRRDAKLFPNITLFPARLEIMFGTHHSKMMFLRYKSGMRVIVHTANLIAKDWDQKTQGVWISPMFPSSNTTTRPSSYLSQPSSSTASHCTNFQHDLLEYLDAYGGSALNEWKKWIRNHDMSSARVRLIASVPGAHTGSSMHKWGHLKLRKVLSEFVSESGVDEHWPVVGQFSSIGSLGPGSNWLCAEWLQSLSSSFTTRGCLSQKNPDLKLIFPSVDNVRRSLEGYIAGGSIPYSVQNAQKQLYLKSYIQWKAERTGRTHAAPHIKTYTRLSPDCLKALWFLVTSANLSKAAWGCFEKKGTQLKIRSYEIGVLFLPSDFSPAGTVFSLPSDKMSDSSDKSDSEVHLRCSPFDIPLTKYSAKDEPWVWNTQYHDPDRCGNMWTPPK